MRIASLGTGQQQGAEAAAAAEAELQAALGQSREEAASLQARLAGESAALAEAERLRVINSNLQL
jgi:hypothetical protein